MERLVTLKDIEELTTFFYRDISVVAADLLKKGDAGTVSAQLEVLTSTLKNVNDWKSDTIEVAIRELQEQNEWKKGQFFMMVRVAVTGKTATPPLFETMSILGQSLTLKRLAQAQEVVRQVTHD